MSYATLAMVAWLLIGQIGALLPSKDHHWRFFYMLLATGIPIFIWFYLEHGWLYAMLILLASLSVFRWPIYFAWRFLRSLGKSRP